MDNAIILTPDGDLQRDGWQLTTHQKRLAWRVQHTDTTASMKAHIKSVFGTFQGDSTYIILDTIPPLPPTNVATSIIESSKTLFTWEHSLSPDVIGYNVNYTRVSKGSNTGVSSRITTGYNTSALWDRLLVFGGANDSTIATKTLSVQAVDKAGNESDPVSISLERDTMHPFVTLSSPNFTLFEKRSFDIVFNEAMNPQTLVPNAFLSTPADQTFFVYSYHHGKILDGEYFYIDSLQTFRFESEQTISEKDTIVVLLKRLATDLVGNSLRSEYRWVLEGDKLITSIQNSPAATRYRKKGLHAHVFPNPVYHSSEAITFSVGSHLQDVTIAKLTILDLHGGVLFTKNMDSPIHQYSWNGRTRNNSLCPNGVFSVVIKTSTGETITSSFVLSR
jgi:hypothetical protein